jgi:phenylalanyl-tRNA synthetase beta chain
MRVTRSWLEEFIDLSDVSNERLYEVFNAIGLEVDSLEQITIPEGVVIGKVLSCEKHPDADKLNVCQIDIGEGIRQIVCGAANVVDAAYVAVATVGTTLAGDFHIKPAELRGVKSDGMVCSSTELGLPKINDGIMILDESIGILDIGKDLNIYPKIADTIIELELTANRGDCLSIQGVARDLSAVLNKDIKPIEYKKRETSKVAIARRFNIINNTEHPVDLLYKLSESDTINTTLLIALRLGFAELEISDNISNILRYSTHATGVILRAYDPEKLQAKGESVSLLLEDTDKGLVALKTKDTNLSVVGVNQVAALLPDNDSEEILFEASYIGPEIIIEGVAQSDVETDLLYYKTSRGSEPELALGIHYLEWQCLQACNCSFADSFLSLECGREERVIAVNYHEIDQIIGQKMSKSEVTSILSRLGFQLNQSRGAESFGAMVPPHRHDVNHIQDIAEEILRIVGINNIQAQPLKLTEKVRLTESTLRYKAKRDIRSRAVGRGFYEAVTYAFANVSKLEKHGFAIVEESLKLLNPIAEEFNGMRSTLLINLLDAVKRNVSYGIKRIPLFEIGTIFDAQRNESEKIAFVWSGHAQTESVINQGKAKNIDFASFVSMLSAVIGNVTLSACESENGLMHPYQSAHIIKENEVIGFVSKLHPSVAESYGIPNTFIAEMAFDALLPKHITAQPISNYQGVYKDLSIVLAQALPFSDISTALAQIDNALLKQCYAVDIYQDEALGSQKSVTIRCFIQSMEGTLSDKMIDEVMQQVLQTLEQECGATIR